MPIQSLVNGYPGPSDRVSVTYILFLHTFGYLHILVETNLWSFPVVTSTAVWSTVVAARAAATQKSFECILELWGEGDSYGYDW